jgi:hypothetical protein
VLAKTGRRVDLHDLSAWRRSGLLPPFASCGTGAGRSYYWRELHICRQAELVFDALARSRRVDAALIAVWFAGFHVPLSSLRRSLLHRMRNRAATGQPDSKHAEIFPDPGLGALMALAHSDPRAPQKLPGAPRWDRIRSRSDLRYHLHRLAALYRPLTENIDTVRRSLDAELLKARHYLRKLLTAREIATEASSETLFLFLLALVRSDQDDILQKIDALSLGDPVEARAPQPEFGRRVRALS